jgi:hypothetical protein
MRKERMAISMASKKTYVLSFAFLSVSRNFKPTSVVVSSVSAPETAASPCASGIRG